VFVVRGVLKRLREYFLIWEEGKGPDTVIEMTSRSTSREDMEVKFELYRDVLKVREYFLFDPYDEYLRPSLQGFRLARGKYARIRPLAGRLPSKVLGLHLERQDWHLRLYDPNTQRLLLTPAEHVAAHQQAEAARQQAEAVRQGEAAARQQAEAEVERLRRELETLRGQRPPRP
jgi:hypothetical protein